MPAPNRPPTVLGMTVEAVSTPTRRRTRRFPVGAKFAAFSLLMVPLALLPVVLGLTASAKLRRDTDRLRQATQATATLSAFSNAVDSAEQQALLVLAATGTRSETSLQTQFRAKTVPAVNSELEDAEAQLGGLVAAPLLKQLGLSWQHVLQRLPDVGGVPGSTMLQKATGIHALFTPLDQLKSRIDASLDAATVRISRTADGSSVTVRTELLAGAGLMVVVGLGGMFLLWLSVSPRARRYSRFAGRIARGQTETELSVTGHDELADLGTALNDLVARHAADERQQHYQAEFAHAVSLAQTEPEARSLLERQIVRSVPASRVLTLSANNSANRLLPNTDQDPATPLGRGLTGAAPRDCLAVRAAEAHESEAGGDALVECGICGRIGTPSLCVPLLVSGEVIGAVLVTHQEPLDRRQRWAIAESVSLAAPALGNLRNLAIAEQRAATDALTGLPNRRSLDDSVRMLVARAQRSGTPLALLSLDLDHFKHVNDTYGHAAGDSLLAALGALLRSSVRASDFAARAGGEEFTVLLADTDRAGARALAEKIRKAVQELDVPEVMQRVTISIGLAVLPDDAVDADQLLRNADRALYTAKSNGRNRTESFATGAHDDAAVETVERLRPEDNGSRTSVRPE